LETQSAVQVPEIVLTSSATRLGSAKVPVTGMAEFQSPPPIHADRTDRLSNWYAQ
jgi:hypothetical protein